MRGNANPPFLHGLTPRPAKSWFVSSFFSCFQNYFGFSSRCSYEGERTTTRSLLFLLRKTPQKIAIFGRIFFSKSRWILTFSLEETLDLAPILLIRPKFGQKMRFLKSKNAPQNKKNRQTRNFQNWFLYLFLPDNNHFRYRNARSHRPVLETEGKF